ncbi:uncharacterized protein LOC135837954 [Planococcus citri]|uniref:uncharacterized protein LOC135837954 n=1 Tax=Planococcus citri TaxID=170843 RepID=UPI0031F7C347
MDSETYKKMTYSATDLQCLAAKSVCIRLVHEWAEGEMPVIDVWKKGNGYDTCSVHDWFLWQLYEMPVPRIAIIPNLIRNQIEDNMALIVEQVMVWIQYHHGVNFFHDQSTEPTSSLSEYVVKLVWNHQFKIDYAATAANILTNENLSPLERFRFASTYCIVEQMEKFRDAMDSIPEWDFITDPFVVYWSKYLKNELDTISVPEDFSIDTIMFIKTSEEYDFWPPVAYFFDKLDSVSKSSKFERIVELYGKRYLKDLLAKLTDKEWNLACRNSISKLVQQIVLWGALDDVRYVWKLFRTKMDSKNFCSILETLVPLSMRNADDFVKWSELLVEIWSSASSKLKQSAVDMKLWESIGEKCIFHIPNEETQDFQARRQIADPMKFIRLVLKTIEAKKRSTFFEKNFCWLIIWAPFAEVDKLMRDFLERYNRDVAKVKKGIAESPGMERSLMILLGFGEFDEFDTAISFYIQGVGSFFKGTDDTLENSMMCLKWTLIMNTAGLSTMSICLYFADWRSLFEYVKKMVSWQSIAIAPDAFMITLIEMGFVPGVNHLTELLIDCKMKVLQQCLGTILSPNDHRLKGLKKKFKDHMFKTMFDSEWNVERIFNRADTRDFLLWIYNGDENLMNKNFRQPHLFPKGFLVHLKYCASLGPFQVSKSMEEFLEWCFETEEERREFKREMIFKFREYKVIEDLLTRRRYRRAMLYWFFDGDVSAIEKFTDEYGHDPIYTGTFGRQELMRCLVNDER